MPLASEEDGAGRWSVDHLFLDQDAIPTIVEVKRSTDTRIRREVVGQMLDYAANAVVYWPVEGLRAQFEAGREDHEQALTELLEDTEVSPEEFWQKVKTNLQAGKVRLIFVSDEIPTQLRCIVEFLNQQMDPAEVLAVEIKQYVSKDEKLKTLVPRVIGLIAGTRVPISDKGEAYRSFFQNLIDRLWQLQFTKKGVSKPRYWHSFTSGFKGIDYGVSFAQGGQVRADIYIDRGVEADNKKLFGALAEKRKSLEDEFEEELAWERLDGKATCRIAVYRPGSIKDDPQTLEEIKEWAIDRLLKFKKVFTPRLAELVDYKPKWSK